MHTEEGGRAEDGRRRRRSYDKRVLGQRSRWGYFDLRSQEGTRGNLIIMAGRSSGKEVMQA